MNKILVIANKDSDLLDLLRAHCDVTVIPTDGVEFDTDEYDAMCVLGGTEGGSVVISSPLHCCLDRMREAGKPVFLEFMNSFGATRGRGSTNTSRQRTAYFEAGFPVAGLTDGDLLNAQANDCVKYAPLGKDSRPILTYQEDACAHSNLKFSEEEHRNGQWALWWLEDATLVSSIRLCNFHRARFSPAAKWQALVGAVVSHLAGEEMRLTLPSPVYTYDEVKVTRTEDTYATVRRGLDWISRAGMLKKGGAGGVYEGFSNRISARDGVQAKNYNVRTDCTCEIGGALLFDAILTGNAESRRTADALLDFAFTYLQVKEGECRGMLRWSELAWDTCYQDDAARAVVPLLLCQHLDAEVPHLDEILEALDYMLDTTGADGIRVSCTEMHGQTPEAKADQRKAGCAAPCAHFNSYYHAALLLAYRLCGREAYLTCAERGLATLMAAYPNTRRETSETEECARLIFPLAVLYGVTGKREHYEWLSRVADDLELRRHPSGGYAEWDTDYQAACSRNHKGECALLAENGDPVADLLYSNNWLPLGFAYAYMVTGEKRFGERWLSHASFICSAQMHSEDATLDGAWARAFDMDTRENCGMPHDAGWGPCCIESGWTVGEILIGLQFMTVAEKKAAKINV